MLGFYAPTAAVAQLSYIMIYECSCIAQEYSETQCSKCLSSLQMHAVHE